MSDRLNSQSWSPNKLSIPVKHTFTFALGVKELQLSLLCGSTVTGHSELDVEITHREPLDGKLGNCVRGRDLGSEESATVEEH